MADIEGAVLATLLVTSSVYAVWLSLEGPLGGKQWTIDYTWLTVTIGCGGIILIGSLVDSHEETSKWLVRFAVAGLPIIWRSLVLDIRRRSD